MLKSTRIVFMGTPAFACTILQRLLNENCQVVGVVSQPDKKVGRKQLLQMTPVKELALANQLPVLQPVSIKTEYTDILAWNPDLIITCAYGQIIPDIVLNTPVYGSINVHASLLPKLRGGAPIHKAIINGDKESGISIMRMVKKMDAGAVMAQRKVIIEQQDTTGSLSDKLSLAGADLLMECIPLILNGTAVFREQDEAAATFAYNISKEEEKITFTEDVQEVYNHIRGLIPAPIGYAILNQKKMKFHRVRMKRQPHAYQPGEMIGMMDGGYAIAASNGFILVDELQLEGKNKVDAKAYFNGSGRNDIGKIMQ